MPILKAPDPDKPLIFPREWVEIAYSGASIRVKPIDVYGFSYSGYKNDRITVLTRQNFEMQVRMPDRGKLLKQFGDMGFVTFQGKNTQGLDHFCAVNPAHYIGTMCGEIEGQAPGGMLVDGIFQVGEEDGSRKAIIAAYMPKAEYDQLTRLLERLKDNIDLGRQGGGPGGSTPPPAADSSGGFPAQQQQQQQQNRQQRPHQRASGIQPKVDSGESPWVARSAPPAIESRGASHAALAGKKDFQIG